MKQLRANKIIIIAIWIIAILVLSVIRVMDSYSNKAQLENIITKMAYDKDITYRRWVSNHGGVYVPVSEHTLPNPYLKIENRDIVTNFGDTLTLMNPAYVTRQALEFSSKEYNLKGRLVSLNPVNPLNAPDSLERAALLAFEKGDTLFSTNETVDSIEYHRYIHPFKVEASCLKCHAHQVYKVGDIRGALSISVPLTNLNKLLVGEIHNIIFLHFIILFLGISIIVFILNTLDKHWSARLGADQALKESKSQLIAINADKDRFISTLAHDLRNPFVSILGFSDLLIENIDKYDRGKILRQIELIHHTSHKTYQLLDDLLLWSHSQSDKIKLDKQKVDFGELCRESIELVQTQAKRKNISIQCFETENLQIFADINSIKTVLRNLISNAVKFTNQNGQIKIYAKRDLSNAVITVSDNGVGIDKDVIPKLWCFTEQISTTGTDGEQGTGFGLVLCKELIEKHGGKIWVESEPGKGSDFKFSIPLSTD